VTKNDDFFMHRAIELAELGGVSVAPNPKVGAVIVHNGEIIGEGYHQQYGGPHAEVNAVNSVKDKNLLKEATIYVSLEPCSHYGKTPPCCDLLIKHQFKRVVIGNTDPNPVVNGKGIERLKSAGIEVCVGVLEKECAFMNRRFLTFQREKRPYIILKWAETADGFIDFERKEGSPREIHVISGEESHRLVHQWRSEEQAILVGWKTIQNDDPQLNVRLVDGKSPIRIILDSNLYAPHNSKVFIDGHPTIIYNKITNEIRNNLQYIQLKNVTFVKLFSSLFEKRIISVLVEGGRTTLNEFIQHGKWDEIRRFRSKVKFGKGMKAPDIRQQVTTKNQTIIVGDDELDLFFR